jgi:hypothetical protein
LGIVNCGRPGCSCSVANTRAGRLAKLPQAIFRDEKVLLVVPLSAATEQQADTTHPPVNTQIKAGCRSDQYNSFFLLAPRVPTGDPEKRSHHKACVVDAIRIGGWFRPWPRQRPSIVMFHVPAESTRGVKSRQRSDRLGDLAALKGAARPSGLV